MTIVKLEFKNKFIYGISLYCSPFQSIEIELYHLKETINAIKPENYIICMDSNARSKVWFDKRDDKRGNILLEFISEQNLYLLNDNINTPTYYTTSGDSYIDLTLVNNNLINYTNDWKVLECVSMSDHRFIDFVLSDELPNIKYKTTRKYFVAEDKLELFGEKSKQLIRDLNQQLISLNNKLEINQFVIKFNGKLTEVCNNTFKEIDFNRTKIKSNHWWTTELTVKRHQMNVLRRRYQRCQTVN
jgi:hypothetical protein